MSKKTAPHILGTRGTKDPSFPKAREWSVVPVKAGIHQPAQGTDVTHTGEHREPKICLDTMWGVEYRKIVVVVKIIT